MNKRMELNKVKWNWWFMAIDNLQNLRNSLCEIIKSRKWTKIVFRGGRWIENKALAWTLVLSLFHLKLIVNFVVITPTIFHSPCTFDIPVNPIHYGKKFGLFMAALDMNCSLQIWKIKRLFCGGSATLEL